MMRLFTVTLCLTMICATPVPALAQSHQDVRDSARTVREREQNVGAAHRSGDREDLRRAQRNLYEAKAEHHETWRDYRRAHRDLYTKGDWRAPFPYQHYFEGARVPSFAYQDRYLIRDPRRYRLPHAGRNRRWVRHYDDILLVNIHTGRVHDVIHGLFW